jgi:DNA-directed RNA polymerase subunit RPC12/RpoP
MRDLNPKGYKITEENNKTYVNGEEKSLKEILILLSLRPYWAKSDFKYEEYRGLILHKTTISKIIEFDDQAYKDVLKACVKDGRPLYYVKIRAVDGVLYADSDANLDSMSLPIHESWVTGRPSNKEWRPPDLCYEMDREKPLSKMIGCAIGNDGMKCANCGKIMSSMSGYTLHAKTCRAKPISTDGTVYACHICGKKTISSYGLTNHIKSAHQIQIKEDA